MLFVKILLGLSRKKCKKNISYPDNIFLMSYPNNGHISNPSNIFLSRSEIYSLFGTRIPFSYLVHR